MKDISQKSKRTVKQKIWWALILFISFTALIILVDQTPYGGQIEFYSKWGGCGTKPLREPAHFDSMRYYEESPNIDLFRLRPQAYFCTPLEAEEAGYSANKTEYIFPHLTTEERRAVMEKYGQ